MMRATASTPVQANYFGSMQIEMNSGQIAPLDEIVRLTEKYRFRVILEESHSFGVLGKSGRGLAEHYGVPVSVLLWLFLTCFTLTIKWCKRRNEYYNPKLPW